MEQIERQEEQRFDMVRQCLKKLPLPDRELIERRYLEGENVHRLANASGAPESTIYKRLARIRGSLQRCVERTISRQKLVN